MDKATLILILMDVCEMREAYQKEDISQQTDYTMGKQIAADQIIEMLKDTIDSIEMLQDMIDLHAI
jgi:hypothetical protein